MRLPLEKQACTTVLSVYAPTIPNPEENKEQFYSQLREVLSNVPKKDKLIINGDVNARVGQDHEKWEGVIGRHGTGKCNSKGKLLLALCAEHDMVITHTTFKRNEHDKVTWMHPHSKHWHTIDCDNEKARPG